MESHFETPHGRQALLRRIAPIREEALTHHSELLEIFHREIEYRSGPAEVVTPNEDDLEYFENIYWCAFLLFIIGDVNDVPLLWRAKNLDMDLAIGMDWEFLVGAGIDETVQFASENKMHDLQEYLRDYQYEPSSLVGWAAYRSYYFYSRRISEE